MPTYVYSKKQGLKPLVQPKTKVQAEQSPLRLALKKHFEAFKGLTQRLPQGTIYKDTAQAQSEVENG